MSSERGGEAHGVAKGLAEGLLVVIAGQGEDGAAIGEKWLEHALQMADGVAEAFVTGQFAEDVAGDEEDVNFFGATIVGDPLDAAAEVLGAVDAAQAVAEMPVGGVQDAHERRPPEAGACVEGIVAHEWGWTQTQ